MNSLMVVDDEEGVRRSLRRILEKDGYRVVLAESGEEAVRLVREDKNELETVISDYKMPGMNGLETLVEIGRINSEITRIMLTGYATMTTAIEAVNAGIDGFLTKPFENTELLAKIREYNVKKRLKQFVPEQILMELQKNTRSIMPKRMEVTILFGDIRGFSRLAEQMSPPELADLLNRDFFTPIDNIIVSCRGTLDKHIGDSVMGIFGAPVADLDDSLRAVEAAIRIREELTRIKEDGEQKKPAIEVGIGIATGEVMAGIFGSGRKKEYTAFGAPVNLAARLESIAEASQILICERTAELVKNHIRLEPVNIKTIRGFSKTPAIYAVLGKKDMNN